MKPLGDSYRKNTYHYEIIKRVGDIAIAKQRLRPGVGCLAYEVIIIQKKEASEIKGVIVEAHEAAPGNEQFGNLGWTYPNLERAEKKMAELLKREAKADKTEKK